MATSLEQYVEDLMAKSSRFATMTTQQRQWKTRKLFIPMCAWVLHQIQSQPSHQTCCVGISCVQGGGKTTTCEMLEKMLKWSGKKCVCLSIDDVYLDRNNQLQVAEQNRGNPLLQHRGNPGTHDLDLLLDFIQQCRSATDASVLQVPQYDKSQHQGRGDRVPLSQWKTIHGPVDVVLLEGWCLGFRALKSADAIRDTNANLLPINKELVGFERIYKLLNALVVLRVQTPKWSYRWREDAEADLRRDGKPAMTSAQVQDFMDRFMPSYDTYLNGLYEDPTTTDSIFVDSVVQRIPRIVFDIDYARLPVDAEPELFNMK